MQIIDILSKFDNVKKNRNGWIGLCPSHADKQRSLSISEKDGNIGLKCFAGCDIQNIVSTIGLEMKDLFAEKTNNFQPKTPPKKIVAKYDYTDENGEVLYQNVRYEPKNFIQRRPDGKGGYVYNLKGVRRVPYRLPELIQRTSDSIFLTEGEKDCDNLRKLGLTASGFKNWRSEFNQFVKDADIVLLADHDKSGSKQANDACEILSGNVASLKIVDLFANEPLPEKHGKDVSDYIEICKKEEDLSDEDIAERICITAETTKYWQPVNGEIEPIKDETVFQSCLVVKPANEWLDEAKLRPVPKMLFGEIWFEGELCILFADTNLGKSILAVQIAESISNGKSIVPFKLETEPQKVIYFDFELSDKQFETRYAERNQTGDFFTNHYQFSKNFLRGEINPESEMPKHFRTFEEYLNFSIEYLLAKTNAKILIVDNLTYLRSETEKAKDALPLMKELKKLKQKHGLSILALAHTPKRDLSKPITRNDLQGSKMLINFCDSSFAIGESSKDKNLRYIKQIKERNTNKIYDAENVCIFQIEKPTNFLRFDFIEFGKESEHLKQVSEKDKDELIEKVKELSRQGKSQRDIGSILGVSAMTVSRYSKM
jgi:RecA-family ATPase